MLETFRSCVQDVFDLPGLTSLMEDVRSRTVAVDDVETRSPSPFARSLVFAYTATYLYQLDMPVAERRTQALSLDQRMLRELLGDEALREFLDADVIDRIAATLQCLVPERQARHADGIHDLLRRVGDLAEAELAERFVGDGVELALTLEALATSKRIAQIEVAGDARWIVAEDAAIYRDALGSKLPSGLPAAFLEPAPVPLEQLLLRFASTNPPFETSMAAARLGLLPAQIEPILDSLAVRGRLIAGEFDPRGHAHEWCEPDVLRRIKRGTLERLREEISAVPPDVLGRFLLDWHGVHRPASAALRFDAVINSLVGIPLSFAELERTILPSRVPNYDTSMIDALGAQGTLVWVGHGAIGNKDGRVVLFRRDRIDLLFEAQEEAAPESEIETEIIQYLSEQGASFFAEMSQAIHGAGRDSLFEGLWSLVWKGLVTNDTFAPLRAFGERPAPHRRRGRNAPPLATAGRWSLVSSLLRREASATQRLHARTLLFLERHGIVSRESMQHEVQLGGFGAVYPVLRELEERGEIRRGHFVEGMSSAQFAMPGAVDRLRAHRTRDTQPRAVLLAATDPAQPYGFQLDWPPTRGEKGRPRRAVHAAVVLVDGTPSLFVDAGGRRILSFEDPENVSYADRVEAAARSLAAGAGRFVRGSLRVEEIDGQSARESVLSEHFIRAGFRTGYRGLEIDTAPREGEVPVEGEMLGGGSAAQPDSLSAHEERGEDGDSG